MLAAITSTSSTLNATWWTVLPICGIFLTRKSKRVPGTVRLIMEWVYWALVWRWIFSHQGTNLSLHILSTTNEELIHIIWIYLIIIWLPVTTYFIASLWLSRYFRLSVRTGAFSTLWKRPRICPVFKKNDWTLFSRDATNHQILLHKISYFGFIPPVIKLFDSYLSDRRHYVLYNEFLSYEFSPCFGVP